MDDKVGIKASIFHNQNKMANYFSETISEIALGRGYSIPKLSSLLDRN